MSSVITPQKVLILQANMFGFVILLAVAKSIIVPLVIALFIWRLIHALSERIALHIPYLEKRSLALSLLLAIFLVILVAQVARLSALSLISEIPKFSDRWDALLRNSSGFLTVPVTELIGELDFTGTLQYVARSILSLSGNLFIIILYIVFLFLEQQSFPQKLTRLIRSQHAQERAAFLYASLSEKIQTYVWIKSLISAGTGFVTFLCLLVFGVNFAGLWALLTFLLNYIPHLGSLIAVLLTVIFSLLQFDHIYNSLTLLICLTAVQIFFGNFLEPRLMGKSLNLSPLVILVSLVTWGSVWGIAGAFLSVPLMVVLAIILAEFPSTRWLAIIMSRNGML